MTLLLMLLVIAVVVAVAAVATGRITGAMDDPVSSLPARPLAEDAGIGPADVARVRFSPALRGYRMEEVDRTLDRLVLELARRDEELAVLRGRLGEPGPDHDDLALSGSTGSPVGAPVSSPAGVPAGSPAAGPVAAPAEVQPPPPAPEA